mgnify:FL=1
MSLRFSLIFYATICPIQRFPNWLFYDCINSSFTPSFSICTFFAWAKNLSSKHSLHVSKIFAVSITIWLCLFLITLVFFSFGFFWSFRFCPKLSLVHFMHFVYISSTFLLAFCLSFYTASFITLPLFFYSWLSSWILRDSIFVFASSISSFISLVLSSFVSFSLYFLQFCLALISWYVSATFFDFLCYYLSHTTIS